MTVELPVVAAPGVDRDATGSPTEKLRVALVCPYDWNVPGGVGTHVRDLALALRARGHHIDILTAGSTTGRARRKARRTGAEVIMLGRTRAVPYNGSIARVSLSLAAVARLALRLRSGGYDIVHVHEPAVPLLGPVAVRMARAPVVVTFHATITVKARLRLLAPLLRPLLRPVVARIAVSASAQATWQTVVGHIDATIPNGLSDAAFAASAPASTGVSEHPAVVFVGRIEPRKGLEDLLAAWPQLVASIDAVQLVIVTPTVTPALEAMLARTAAPDRVHVVVGATTEQVREWYSSAAVVCAPARGGESFGMVLAEAMAVGSVVVCSDIPGYREVARTGREAVLVSPHSPLSLAAGLLAALRDPDLRARTSAAGRARADELAWSKVVDQVLTVYAAARLSHGSC